MEGNPFEGSRWYKEHLKDGQTIYVGDMLFRQFSTDEIIVDASVKRISEECFMDKLRKPSAMWIDEGRVEVLESKDAIEPVEVQSEHRGGCIDIAIPGRYLSQAALMGI